jgi:hypothetical protein
VWKISLRGIGGGRLLLLSSDDVESARGYGYGQFR